MPVARLTIGISLLLVLTGCGALKVEPLETATSRTHAMVEDRDLGKVFLAPGFDFRGYDTLVVGDIAPGTAVPLKDMDPEAMGIYLKNSLVRRLTEIGVFRRVTDDKSVLTGGQGKVLLLEGSFSELDPGSRALRLLGYGYGAGRTKVQVETELKDPATKRLLFSASDRRVGAAGYAGGDSDAFVLESLDKVAEGHALFIKRVATAGKP